MALIGKTNEEKIWNYFSSKFNNDYGTAGLIGNLYCESSLKPTNMQNSYEKKLGYNDETYTEAVDNGTYTDFVHDKVGYGLAQHTFWSRKQNLLNFAKSKNKSIGDLEMQLDFIYKELTESYKKVFNDLKNATSVSDASNSVILNYERPANQSEENQKRRAQHSQTFYDKYHKESQTNGDGNMNNNEKFTNSSLVSYTKISPNRTSPRTHDIDTITIHCVVGQVTVERLGDIFAPTSKKASSNYGVGKDGKIGMYVEEKDRSWCSSSSENDNRAITIEVASDTTHPYAVTDAAYEALIELVADICKRNNIKELKWKADKSLIGKVDQQNMTVHRWFAAKACPGDYLYNRHGDIANRVNKLLGVVSSSEPEEILKVDFKIGDEVKLVDGATYSSGKSIPAWVFDKVLYVRAINDGDITISTLKSGAVTGNVYYKYLVANKKDEPAKEQVQNPTNSTTLNINLGDEVKLVAGATYTSGKSIPNWVFNSILYVREIRSNNDVVVSTLKTGAVTGIVNAKYLRKDGESVVAFTPYKVKVTADSLNIRDGAGTNYKINGTINDKGIYTIVDEDDSGKWGFLKSKAGWISLAYTEKV